MKQTNSQENTYGMTKKRQEILTKYFNSFERQRFSLPFSQIFLSCCYSLFFFSCSFSRWRPRYTLIHMYAQVSNGHFPPLLVVNFKKHFKISFSQRKNPHSFLRLLTKKKMISYFSFIFPSWLFSWFLVLFNFSLFLFSQLCVCEYVYRSVFCTSQMHFSTSNALTGNFTQPFEASSDFLFLLLIHNAFNVDCFFFVS